MVVPGCRIALRVSSGFGGTTKPFRLLTSRTVTIARIKRRIRSEMSELPKCLYHTEEPTEISLERCLGWNAASVKRGSHHQQSKELGQEGVEAESLHGISCWKMNGFCASKLSPTAIRRLPEKGQEDVRKISGRICGSHAWHCALLPLLGGGGGGGLGIPANRASISESQDQQASLANGTRRVFGGFPEPTPPCRAPLR